MSKRPRQDSTSHQASSYSLSTDEVASSESAQQPGKYTHLDVSTHSADMNIDFIRCALPPHKPLGFANHEDYETHYQQTHVNRCTECDRNFPTDHFLNLHIAENHDPITAAKRDRGDKIYQCFVEGCDKLCSTWQKRRMHLVDAHMFPRNYDFFIVNDGLDNRKSMLRPDRSYRRRSSASSRAMHRKDLKVSKGESHATASSVKQDQSASNKGQSVHGKMSGQLTDTTMDDIADSMAALKFIPKSVTFGRRQGGGLAKS